MNAPGDRAPTCRDCKHARPHKGIASLFGLLPSKWGLATCSRTMRPEPAYPGSTPGVIVVHRHPLATIERAIEFHACGQAARYFEARGGA